jgi:tetratricopeptide (TPR) repeat protein
VAALARAEGDADTSILAETTRGYFLRCLGRVEEAVQVLEAAASLVEEQGTEESLNVLTVLAETYLWTSHLEQARTQLAHNLANHQQGGNNAMVAYHMTRIGETYFADGDWCGARTWYAQALQVQQAESRSWGAIFPLAHFGELALREWDWAEADRLLDAGMLLSRENQDPQWLWLLPGLLIERDLLRGQVDQAFARHVRLIADPDQAAKLTSHPSSALGMLFLAVGDIDHVDNLIEGAIQFWGQDGVSLYTWIWIALRAKVLAARKRWAKSEATFLDAIARVRRTRHLFSEAQALQWHGEILAAHGETERARQRLQEAREIYLGRGAAPNLSQTDEVLARLGP